MVQRNGKPPVSRLAKCPPGVAPCARVLDEVLRWVFVYVLAVHADVGLGLVEVRLGPERGGGVASAFWAGVAVLEFRQGWQDTDFHARIAWLDFRECPNGPGDFPGGLRFLCLAFVAHAFTSWLFF